jgi:hypothetical protein
MRNATGWKRGPTTRPRIWPVWWGPSPLPWVQLLQTLASQNLLNLKPTIKRNPVRSRDGSAKKHDIHITDLQTARLGYAAEAAPGCPFDYIDIISFSSMMKNYGIMEVVTRIKLSLMHQ